MLAAPQSKAESDLYDPPAQEGGAQYFCTFTHRERKEPQFDETESLPFLSFVEKEWGSEAAGISDPCP